MSYYTLFFLGNETKINVLIFFFQCLQNQARQIIFKSVSK